MDEALQYTICQNPEIKGIGGAAITWSMYLLSFRTQEGRGTCACASMRVAKRCNWQEPLCLSMPSPLLLV